jgi:hypothetical protein
VKAASDVAPERNPPVDKSYEPLSGAGSGQSWV